MTQTQPAAAQPGAAQPGAAAAGEVLAEACGVGRTLGRRIVLNGVDLRARAGRVLAVRGPSGSGKSTLLRLLTGLDRPDAGTIQLAGHDLATLDRDQRARLRRRVAAVVGQDVQLAETLSVTGNLELARALRGLPPDPDAVRHQLARLDLAPLASRAARQLSGGERQRAAVARALVTGARLLVLDEPTSQLDEAHAEQLADVLLAAARDGAAVVVSSHDPTLVASADDVLDLRQTR